jgi:hypothetical protein
MTCASCAVEVVSLAMTYVYGSQRIRASARGNRPGFGSDCESSTNRPRLVRNDATGSEPDPKAAVWSQFATPRYTPSGDSEPGSKAACSGLFAAPRYTLCGFTFQRRTA